MEKPTSVFLMQDVLGCILREQIQEWYLCGPRLEVQLTGRAESAVEECTPGLLFQEHGVETLLRILRTHCAMLELPDMGPYLQTFFYKLKRKKHEPMASWGTRCRKRVHQGLTSFGKAATDRDTRWHGTATAIHLTTGGSGLELARVELRGLRSRFHCMVQVELELLEGNQEQSME